MNKNIINKIKSQLYSIDNEIDEILASDFDLNPNVELPKNPPKPAAVLIPLIERENGLFVILTRRSLELKVHSGQIAFPGGRFDEGDANLVQTALREAHEEIGLAPQFVTPIARGSNYLSASNFLISPIFGLVDKNAVLIPNKDEVDEIFEIPFEFLFDKTNHEIRNYIFSGVERHFYAITFHKHFVWGVTAGLICALSRKIGDFHANRT